MVATGRTSNSRLMARVLEAVKHLHEGKGSSAKQVLEVLRMGNKPAGRNLAMQVQRALKHAVTAGLLQLRSGRYKMLIPLKNSAKNRADSGTKNVSKSRGGNKKDDLEDARDSDSLQAVEARGPRSRCSHCKKHKRKMSRRRRKRSSRRRRKRPTRQAAERKSRKLRRRGEDEGTSSRRERRRKLAAPGKRSQSEVPNGQRSERQGKTDPETNEAGETGESGNRRERFESSSGSEGEEDGLATCTAGRKTDTQSCRSSSKPRRSSRKRNSSLHNDCDEAGMECCDEEGLRGEELADACKLDRRSGTSI